MTSTSISTSVHLLQICATVTSLMPNNCWWFNPVSCWTTANRRNFFMDLRSCLESNHIVWNVLSTPGDQITKCVVQNQCARVNVNGCIQNSAMT
ncbi:LOW QUALITY PROTEIN: hypothetical protein ACHAW6_010306 [Cyclotella cf. meneghiniana]